MASTLKESVRDEIEALHVFFVGWFTGRLPETSFEGDLTVRFDSEFVLIPPAGIFLNLEELQQGLRKGYGSNPDFGIAIRNVRVLRVWDDLVLASYEEWQREALASTPPDNARIATVLFRRSEPLTWLHVHETWMPRDVKAAGPYDF
jgi:hypothetical protein